MNILFISHMFPNKLNPLSSVFISEKAKAFKNKNTMQIVAPVSYFPFLKNKLPPKYETFDGLRVIHYRYLSIPFFPLRWLSYYLQIALYLERYLADCDIVNVEWIYPDCYAINKIAHKYNKKVVVTVHGNEALGYFRPPAHKKMHIDALSAASHIIAVSHDMKNKMVTDYKLSETRITVIPNGIDPKKFYRIPADEAKKQLGIEGSASNIYVCVARLSEEKNLHVMIKAVHLCKENIQLYVIGDGPLKENLQNLINKLGLEKRVFLIGGIPHEKIFLWLNAADYFCLSSIREGCPVVIHEALACGVPVISTTVGAIPDLVKDDRFGLLCEPDSVSAFAAIMRHAMSKTWDRETISAYGQQFTWEKVAEQAVEVFKEVLESGR